MSRSIKVYGPAVHVQSAVHTGIVSHGKATGHIVCAKDNVGGDDAKVGGIGSVGQIGGGVGDVQVLYWGRSFFFVHQFAKTKAVEDDEKF